MQKHLIQSVILLLALAQISQVRCAAASLGDELFKFRASDGAPFRVFGTSVAMSGQRVLVGSPGAGNGGGSPGFAYLFDATTGQELWKFTSSEAAPQHQFGSSVAISGNRAIVGAYGDLSEGAGAAYVIDVTTGQELFKLVVDDAQIGNAVAISGNVAVVGSYSDAAYLFDVTTGQQLFKLTASDTVPNDYFGFSVGISGNTAVVGSLNNGAYLFDVTTGEELLKLTHPESWTGTFGHAVAISGNTVIVGAPVNGSAAAFVFNASTGLSLARLAASEASDLLGISVAIDGNTAIVGGWSYEEEFTRLAFLYNASTGQRLATLTPSDDMALYFQEVNFGEAVAISGDFAVVGFSQDKAYTGSAYVYSTIPEPAGMLLVGIGAALLLWRKSPARRQNTPVKRRLGRDKSAHMPAQSQNRKKSSPSKPWIVAAATLFASVLTICTLSLPARADIFQWAYINPADPGAGRQQSATLAADGAGASAEPGSNLSTRNLTKAYLAGVNLSPYLEYDVYSGYIGGYSRSDLTSANLSQADLSGAALNAATLTGANLSGAFVRGANFDKFDQYGYSYAFGYGTGLTLAQLTSTASYATHDLRGVSLGANNLTGANFSGFDLADARFAGANLTNVNFSNANLTNGVISGTLTGMNLSGAVVSGAGLWGISKSQLYSTASYQTGDLAGIYFYSDDPGWNFTGKNLSQATIRSAMNNANFMGANLAGAAFSHGSLKNASFNQANLAEAAFDYANLTGASMTGAVVRGANFSATPTWPGSGLTLAQLYSTSSYQSHDLTGTRLRGNVLTGANLAGQTLMNVDFVGASLVGADLTGAEVRGALFHRDQNGQGGITATQLQATASYQLHDLSGIGLGGNNLPGVNLAGQNLTSANFEAESGYGANLDGANLSQANLTNAKFGNTTLAGATLVGANLANLDLRVATLTNANLSQANLFGSNFGGYYVVVPGEEGGYYHFPGTNLSGADLRSAKLHFANFSGTEDYVFGYPHPGANLTNVNLSGADARGASFLYATMTGANTANLIQSNGHIAGLDLTAGARLIVRDYELFIGADVPIVVDQHLAMNAAGTLRLEFDADPWGSTISFAPGIPVTLGGTLELTFASDVNLASQIGRTIDLFDWTGVIPTGTFNVSSDYNWDLSKLYTTGEATLASVQGILPGDFNHDGRVDAADYVVWRDTDGTPAAYDVWRSHFGQTVDNGAALPALDTRSPAVPEPSTLMLASLIGLGSCSLRRRAVVG